jgi:hypothetical protein
MVTFFVHHMFTLQLAYGNKNQNITQARQGC